MDLTYQRRQVPGGADGLMKDQGGIEVKKACGHTSLDIILREQNLSFPPSEFRLVFKLQAEHLSRWRTAQTPNG